MKNILGRELPDFIEGYGKVKPFEGAFENCGVVEKKSVKVKSVIPGEEKVLKSVEEAIEKVELDPPVILLD